MYPPVHHKPEPSFSYDRLNMLWDRYPHYHTMSTFASLDELLDDHESYRKDFDDLKEEYLDNEYEHFLVNLSWADLPYRYATKEQIELAGPISSNPYVEAFLAQFQDLDTDKKACFLFPESVVSQFFVIMEICREAE